MCAAAACDAVAAIRCCSTICFAASCFWSDAPIGVRRSVCGDTVADAALVAARGGVLAGEKKLGVPADRTEAICAGDAVLAEGVA